MSLKEFNERWEYLFQNCLEIRPFQLSQAIAIHSNYLATISIFIGYFYQAGCLDVYGRSICERKSIISGTSPDNTWRSSISPILSFGCGIDGTVK